MSLAKANQETWTEPHFEKSIWTTGPSIVYGNTERPPDYPFKGHQELPSNPLGIDVFIEPVSTSQSLSGTFPSLCPPLRPGAWRVGARMRNVSDFHKL